MALLLVAAGFTSLMFNLPALAILAGALAVLAWALAMARGPRPSWKVTLSVGGGLIAMYMWWPAGDESWPAIAMMWLGVALVLFAAIAGAAQRRRA